MEENLKLRPTRMREYIMKKLVSLFLVLATTSEMLLAWDYERIQIGDLYYNLDATNRTAEVTSQYENNPNNYSGLTSVRIQASVVYNKVSYSVKSVGDGAFMGCKNITSVTIPNSVTNIGSTSFILCSISTINFIGSINEWCNKTWFPTSISTNYELFINGVPQRNVIIPKNITGIGNDAFHGCNNLTSITLPNSVKSIGRSAFSTCTGLTSVEIPNSVTSIEFQAFSNCSNLTSITLSNSVKNIGMFAFSGCTGLTSIICKATTPPTCTSITFNGVPKSIDVYVPSASIDAYRGADICNEFTNYYTLSD